MLGGDLDQAAMIYLKAHQSFLVDFDYLGQRNAMLKAAQVLFGVGSGWDFAVRNAYAAINVGTQAVNTPSGPPLALSAPPNDTPETAQVLGWGMDPPAIVPKPAPRKLLVHGDGTSTNWYRVTLTGKFITVRISPDNPFAAFSVTVKGAVPVSSPMSSEPQQIEAGLFSSGPQDVYLFVTPSGNFPGGYTLAIDLQM
jgi:hypothetical protein